MAFGDEQIKTGIDEAAAQTQKIATSVIDQIAALGLTQQVRVKGSFDITISLEPKG
jgi:hypothetical protein